MERDVRRAKKKIKVVPKARKAFQVKYDGQAIPLEFVVATREKYEKFVVSNNLLESCEEEYLEILEKKFTSSKEVDAKSKNGHMVLKWAAFSSVDKMFFFGDDLLCLLNGSHIQVIEDVDTAPKHKTWNLFNAHSAAELIEGTKAPRSFTIQVVAGCPYTPTLAYVISNSPIIHVMTYPQMSLMAELRSVDGNGDYIELHFGIGECLYGLRGHPGNVVEIWSLRSRSILVSIPGSFYSNETIMRLSPISYTMVTIDQGCQDVVRWTLHCTSPSHLLAYPQAVSLTSTSDHSIVDASFTYEDDLYLLSDGGEIYYVDGNNEMESCRLVKHPKNCSRLSDGSSSYNYDGSKNDADQNRGWSTLVCHYGSVLMINNAFGIFKHFKMIRKTYFELEDITTIGEDPIVAINSRASIFKTGSIVRDTTLIAVMNADGLNTTKWNLGKLGPSEGFKGLVNDITVLRNHAIAVERRRIRVIALEDGTTACTIPIPCRINKVATHPFKDIIVVSMEYEGSLYVFKMRGGTVELVDRYQLFTSPIDLMLFSIRGDFFVVRSTTNDIGLFKVYDGGCVGLVTVKSVDHKIDSMTFVSYGEDHFVLAVLENSTGSDYSMIYVYDVPALHCLSYIELPEKLFQLAECEGDGKCFGTSHAGLSVSVYYMSLDNDGGGMLQAMKTLKTYEDVCRRRMTADMNYLMVYGTEGCLDVFAQKDDNDRIFSVTHNLFAFSGYVNAAFCLELKYVVGVHASGVVTCRYLKRRTKRTSADDNSSWALRREDSRKGVSKTDEPTSFYCTKDQKEKRQRNEYKAIIFVHRHLIEELCGIVNEIFAVEDMKDNLHLSFQEELTTAFSEIVSSENLMAIKHRNLKEFNRKARESIVSTTREGLEVLDLYARRYRDLFEAEDTGRGAIHRKHYDPSIIKGVREHSYNFYKSSASAIEEASAEGILLYCTDLVTVSKGFDKYITPRWLRNAGPAAELMSLTVHARKRGVDEDADRPKMDLNKKISEAVENFAVYFIKRRKGEMDERGGVVKEEEDKTTGAELPLIMMSTGLGASADIFMKKEIRDVGGPVVMESAPEEGCNADSGEESSDGDRIPDASNDGTEEGSLSSDSFSSGSTFDLPREEDDQPGSRSSYLIRLLERKEAKKTRKFEMKDGMLKCYHHFTENVKAFIKKFHGSSSHEFLHVFPLCFCPDETDSVFNNHVQFLYSRYFVEGLREHFNGKFEEVYRMRDESVNNDAEDSYDINPVNGEGIYVEPQDCEGESGRFMIEPLKPVSPLMMPLESAGFRQMGDGVARPLNKIEICPAVWKGSDKLNSLVEWGTEYGYISRNRSSQIKSKAEEMKIAMIPACGNCQKEADMESLDHWLKGAIPTLQNVSSVGDIECDQVSKATQQMLKRLLSNNESETTGDEESSKTDAQETLLQLEVDEEEEPDGADLLKLLDEKDKQFLKPTVPDHNLLFDYVKRRKWCVQGQVLSETLQFTMKNYKAQMIGRLMEDCARARSYQDEIVAYLNSLNDKSTEISMFFGELLHIYHEMKPQLNELNHIKKVFQRVSRKHSVPGLPQHIGRMDTFEFEQQDGGSADYLEDLIRTRSIFAVSFQDLSYCKISMEKVFESCKHLGFSTSFNRTQYNIWRTFFSWKSQENELPGDEAVQEEPQAYFKGNLKEDIFQIATDLYVIGITVYLMKRSLLLRLKSLYDTALYIKKQYRVYKVLSIKLQLLENSLENCAKEWINYERILLHFKNEDMYRSYKSPNLSSLSNLVPFEYIGWEIPLIASKADKILLRKVKKKPAKHHPQNHGGHSHRSPSPGGNGGSDRRRAHAQRKESDAVKFGAGILDESEEEVLHPTRRRHSKASPRTKPDLEAAEQQNQQKYLRNKSFFDVSLEDFAKHLEERTEKELMEEMRNPDLASTLQEESLDPSQNSRISSAENSDGDVKTRFCENPIYTNVSHLLDQDRQVKSLEREYYEKLLSLMKAKEDCRKYKAEISNVRTRMRSLSEEYATIKKYIVSRDEAHLITNFPFMADRIKETKIHHETESRNLSAEVKRSLRLIKKGKYDAVEWLMSRLDAVKDESRLSYEEQMSKKSSSVSEQLKSSYRSEQRNSSSKSITNVSISDEKSVENLEEVKQETSAEEETKMDESLRETASKIQKIDKMVAMVLSLGDCKMSYSLCGVHSQSVPPFCCLLEYLNQNLDTSSQPQDASGRMGIDAKESRIILDAEPNIITLTKSDSDAASGIIMNQEELGEILSSFKISKREPGCEFPSDKDEQEFESSSRQSSLKMDATLGSWTDSELEEVIDSGTYSSQDKLDSVVVALMQNKPEIIRQLTHKYIMEKCGELFIDQRTEQNSFESVDGNDDDDDLTKLKTTAERELLEHRRELMSLYEECSSGVHSENEADASRRKQSLYEARLRSEQLMEIRVLKQRIQEKMASVEEMEKELERLRLRKYPTFEH